MLEESLDKTLKSIMNEKGFSLSEIEAAVSQLLTQEEKERLENKRKKIEEEQRKFQEELETHNSIEEAKLKFSRMMKNQRTLLDISQEDLANIFATNRVSISRYESAKVMPSFENLIKICVALGIEFSITCGGEKIQFGKSELPKNKLDNQRTDIYLSDESGIKLYKQLVLEDKKIGICIIDECDWCFNLEEAVRILNLFNHKSKNGVIRWELKQKTVIGYRVGHPETVLHDLYDEKEAIAIALTYAYGSITLDSVVAMVYLLNEEQYMKNSGITKWAIKKSKAAELNVIEGIYELDQNQNRYFTPGELLISTFFIQK